MLQTIQVGRGLAAFAVAAFHLSIGLADPRYLGYPVFESITWRGNLGVDFFFVLSGFIMMLVHHNDIGRPERWRAFALKRAIRVYPIYWLYTLGFCLLVAFNFGTVTRLPAVASDWISVVTLVRFSSVQPPLSPAWTLFHEIAFYAVFSLLLLNRRIGAAALAAWMLVAIILFQYAAPTERTPLATLFSAYNLDFVVGMAAFAVLARLKVWSAAVLVGIGAALIAVCMSLEARGSVFVGFPLLYAIGFGCILSAMVFFEKRREKKLGDVPVVTLLGNASYSIYLTHEALEGLFMKLVLRARSMVPLTDGIVYGAILVATIIGGCFAYLLVERPLLSFLHERLGRARRSSSRWSPAAVQKGPAE
jgi:peptidoglycan/LPS O-acetylase OafA/YrhL